MTIKELIEELSKFSEDNEVVISDGYKGNYYHTDGIIIQKWDDKVDIGIGDCNETEEL